MMMKNLIKTLGFILAVAGPSVAMATTNTDTPQGWTAMGSNIIHNKVCIESEQTPGEHCDVADVTIVDDSYACLSISKSPNLVPSNGNVTITCRASDNTKGHNFRIECGNENGDVLTGYEDAGQSFSRVCHYGDRAAPYNIACYVDDEDPTNPACETTIGYPIPERPCGNGIVDSSIEQCDLGGAYQQLIQCSDESCLSQGNSDYYCLNCAIVYRGNFLYEHAECRYTDTPISVMNNEYVPYRWTLYNKQTQEFTTNEADCRNGRYSDSNKTLLLDDEDSLRCYFVVYNGKNNQDSQYEYRMEPIAEFDEYCRNFDEEYDEQDIFDYFIDTHNWNGDKHPDGLNLNTVNAVTDGHSEREFGEYKLVLQKVEYKVCNKAERKWEDGVRYGAICEVNFAVTEPYIMQISTFGVSPVGSSNKFLENYYAMDGKPILTKSDLSSVIKTDNSDYAVDNGVISKFKEFKNKYESLAVEVTNGSSKSIWNVLGLSSSDVSLKKVPNKSIYFIKKKSNSNVDTLVLSQDDIKKLTAAYTIIVEDMDVEIVGDVLQYAMIVTNQKMSFKDAGPGKYSSTMSCASGGQVVQGIYVALGGFKVADGEKLRNTNDNKKWCPWGGLHVKGVLIGDNIEDITNTKRSQLNSWFNVDSSSLSTNNLEAIEKARMKARRETIIKGASLLIEYSPSLWKTLPPGAEIFTEGLEIYRK